MPSFPCRHPGCPTYVPDRPGYCATHAGEAGTERRAADRWYDEHHRDKAAKAFYNSSAWQRARGIRLAEHPVCERCAAAWSVHVHHIKPLRELRTIEEKTDQGNLKAVCGSCHNIEEAEANADQRNENVRR
jgi:5-methylcytosine-specific restriction protein A